MTDDSIKAKALALINEVLAERELPSKLQMCRLSQAQDEALCRAIERHEADKAEHETQVYVMHSRIAQTEEQHEAFKQEVSDEAQEYEEAGFPMSWEGFERFIIPKPQPDPLVDVFDECFNQVVLEGETWSESMARKTRAALEARGLEIREKESK